MKNTINTIIFQFVSFLCKMFCTNFIVQKQLQYNIVNVIRARNFAQKFKNKNLMHEKQLNKTERK